MHSSAGDPEAHQNAGSLRGIGPTWWIWSGSCSVLRRRTVPAEGNSEHRLRGRRGVVRQLPAQLAAIRTHQICATIACLGSEATVALPALRSLLQQPGVLLDPTRIKLESADPESDLPARLRAYGENRGVVFRPSDRLFRTRESWRRWSATSSSVSASVGPWSNRHRIELFLLDQRCRVAVAFTRLQWDVEDVLAQATSLAERA